MLWDRTMPAEQHGFIKPQKINLYLRFICDAFGWNSLLFAEEFVWVCRTWSLLIYFILKALVSGSFRVWFSRISMCLSFCFFFIICEILERFWILFLSTSLFFSSTHLISFFFFSLYPLKQPISHTLSPSMVDHVCEKLAMPFLQSLIQHLEFYATTFVIFWHITAVLLTLAIKTINQPPESN